MRLVRRVWRDLGLHHSGTLYAVTVAAMGWAIQPLSRPLPLISRAGNSTQMSDVPHVTQLCSRSSGRALWDSAEDNLHPHVNRMLYLDVNPRKVPKK